MIHKQTRIDVVKMIEGILNRELDKMNPIRNQTQEEALDDDIKLLNSNIKVLRGWSQVYNLEQLILLMVQKIHRDYC